jgi:hypothetical protein
MGVVIVPVLVVLVVLVAGAWAVARFSRAEREHSDRLQNSDRPTLRYQVPPGQDPALVLTELRAAGYDASADSEPGPSSPIVIVGTKSGDAPDREELRAVLARIDRANIDPASEPDDDLPPGRFVDEE